MEPLPGPSTADSSLLFEPLKKTSLMHLLDVQDCFPSGTRLSQTRSEIHAWLEKNIRHNKIGSKFPYLLASSLRITWLGRDQIV